MYVKGEIIRIGALVCINKNTFEGGNLLEKKKRTLIARRALN